ncbi:MAG: electron transfer flavoprotein [Leptolyngbya sp.]|nr:MAG: electron transfer flavoprotein [Leptolyngbya sp.]
MKLRNFSLSLISLMAITTVATGAPYQSVNSQNAPAMKPEGSMMKPEGSMMKPQGTMAMRSGKFVKAEHPTQGSVMLVKEGGKSYLTFDKTFKTDAGPDLYVILYRTSQPPIGGIKEKDYVQVAKLQKVSGAQRYAIPQTVKPENFSSVAIWCRKFNATFGYASLGK